MIRAGVIGHPIGHSRSPLIHRHWLDTYQIPGAYEAYDIEPEHLRDETLRLRDAGLKGFNVTLPHKQAVMEICTTLTADAQRIGAVNTVVFYPSGEIEGRNTDAYGFMENAREAQPHFDWRAGPATVLGAGGAARAILFALRAAGVPEIRLTNRTLESAETLAEEFGCRVYEWEDKSSALEGAASLINTTSLGMKGQPALEIDLEELEPGALVYDIVYAPLMTPLLLQAQEKGAKTVTGIGMLLHQARPAFQAWFGTLPEVDDALRAKVLA